MDRASAETIALQALAFLAADSGRLGALCAQTGLDAAALKAHAGEPDFLAGIVDFVMSHELWAEAFAEEMGLSPESLAKIRAALPGANQMGSP